MSRDIVDTSAPSDRLVVAAGIEGQPADQLACSGSRTRMSRSATRSLTGLPLWARPRPMWWSFESWRRVTVPAGVDLVVADAEVGVGLGRAGRPGLDPGAVGLQGRAPTQRPVGPGRVVVVRRRRRAGPAARRASSRGLPGQVALQRLVQALDLAAGLGVVGPRVLGGARSARSSRPRGTGSSPWARWQAIVSAPQSCPCESSCSRRDTTARTTSSGVRWIERGARSGAPGPHSRPRGSGPRVVDPAAMHAVGRCQL